MADITPLRMACEEHAIGAQQAERTPATRCWVAG
jgi:hypothetical protein